MEYGVGGVGMQPSSVGGINDCVNDDDKNGELAPLVCDHGSISLRRGCSHGRGGFEDIGDVVVSHCSMKE